MFKSCQLLLSLLHHVSSHRAVTVFVELLYFGISPVIDGLSPTLKRPFMSFPLLLTSPPQTEHSGGCSRIFRASRRPIPHPSHSVSRANIVQYFIHKNLCSSRSECGSTSLLNLVKFEEVSSGFGLTALYQACGLLHPEASEQHVLSRVMTVNPLSEFST